MKLITTLVNFGVVLFISVIIASVSLAQPMFDEGDIITYSDGSRGWSIDAGPSEVYIATDGGIWRHDRHSGLPLDPWVTGIGWNKAVSLLNGRVLLYHKFSQTLWLGKLVDGQYRVVYYRPERKQWSEIDMAFAGPIALGESRQAVIIRSDGRNWQFDPFTGRFLDGDPVDETIIRWQQPMSRRQIGFRGYIARDEEIWYDDRTGEITYLNFSRYLPSAHYFDEIERRRYVCYPGLGVIVGNETTLSFNWYSPGPGSSDVRAITFDESYNIWVGGHGDSFSYFDRSVGSWKSYHRGWQQEIYSTRSNDAIAFNHQVYFATDEGITYRPAKGKQWRILDRFDGLNDSRTYVLERLDGMLLAGGRDGVNIVKLPKGPIWKTGNDTLDELHVGDMVTYKNAVWIGGVEGLWRGHPEAGWESVAVGGMFGGEAIRSLAIDDSSLWIGSMSGVTRYDRGSTEWSEYYSSTYMRNGMPLALGSTTEDLWVGTDRGLFRYNLERGAWREFTVDHGLPSNRIQRIVIDADTLWIGTPVGLSRFIWNKPERDGL